MKAVYRIFAAAAISLLLSSCSGEPAKEIERTLILESHEVSFTKGAGQQSVNVSVDKGDSFTATWQGADWGEVSVEEDKVVINVKSNHTLGSRSASVIVSLSDGWRNEVISVRQSAVAVGVNIDKTELSCSFLGGEEIVKISSDFGYWEAVTTSKWLQLEAYPQSGELVVAIPESTDIDMRQANIVIKSLDTESIITVEQGAAPNFILPFIDFDSATFSNIESFELERHSVHIGKDMMYGIETYQTKSQMFPAIKYAPMSSWSPNVVSAEAMLSPQYQSWDFNTNDELRNMLINAGFEDLGIHDGINYFWKDNGAEAQYHCLLFVMDGYASLYFQREMVKPY